MNPSNSTLETPQRPSNLRANQFDDKPLWNHVKVLTVALSGGGNRTWSCNYCNKKVTGSYTKVKAHLLKLPNQGVECCKVITDDIHQSIKREHKQVERKKLQDEINERKRAEYVSLPSDSDLLQQKMKKKRGQLGPLEKTFNMAQRDTADKEAARMFYASALSFNFAKSPYFRQFCRTLANSNVAGYTPPTYNRLRTTLLAQEKENINRKLQPIRDSWRKKGVPIVSDGWLDKQRRPLINVMGASAGRAMFIKAIDASSNIKDGEYVAAMFTDAIKQIGSSNVVQIITDNAANYKSAGLSIETRWK
ncbi:uncharacterized protein LOC111408894 isoform X2 [Olea europaea var. sylvestris]|uniref:uncharacterized protein LOC111408894 isoform X2 n=1 Tax=Olea europaea var. sylvestris TaxID=158386 RepID=UPI000C1D46FE|nr:uncharacterized protein LOC111408894 isoform X2 [Olea europaea var. sylvestris]